MPIPNAIGPLSALVLLPLLVVAALAIAGVLARALVGLERMPDAVWRGGGLAGATLTFGVAFVQVLGGFDPERLGQQMIEQAAWLPALGGRYVVGIDGLNLFLVLGTTLIVPVVLLATWNQLRQGVAWFVTCTLVFESATLGVLLSLNLILFYFFWELTALSLYLLISVWGGRAGVRAASRFILHSSLGSLLMLTAIVSLATLNGDAGGAVGLDLIAGGASPGGAHGVRAVAASAASAPWYHAQPWLFAAFALALAVRIPLFPFHTWLSGVLEATPTAVSALVVGPFLATGAYGFLRFALPLFPDAASAAAPFGVVLASCGVVYGGALALVQGGAKRLIGFVVFAQLGVAMLGAFSLTVHGLVGATVQLMSVGFGTTCLVLLFGALEERRKTLALDDYGGLAKPMPVLTVLLALTVLSCIGLPSLAGFVGQWLSLLGGFAVRPDQMAVACIGVVLLAGALLRVLARVSLGPVTNPENRGLIDLDWRERVACLLLIVPLAVVGVQPNPVLRRIEPSVLELLAQIDARRTAGGEAVAPETAPTESEDDDEDGFGATNESGEAI